MNRNEVRRRCLVADDVRGSREMLRQWLMDEGIDVVVERDGQAAWDSLVREDFQLLITDIEMPRLSGLGLLRRIRCSKHESMRKMPVVVITSLLDSEAGEFIAQMGGTTVLVKPLDKFSTVTIVQRVLDGSPVEPLYDFQQSLGGIRKGCTVSPKLRRLLYKDESDPPSLRS